MILSHALFKKIDGRSTEMIINFDSAGVSVTMVYFGGEKESRVLSHISREIRTMEKYTPDELFEVAFTLLKEVTEEIVLVSHKLFQIDDLLKDHQKIQKIHVFVGQPFSKIKHSIELHDNAGAETINQDLISSLLEKTIPQGTDRLDTVIGSVHANGYHTSLDLVFDSRVKELQVSFLDIYMRFDFMETLFQLLTSQFNVTTDDINFKPIESALYSDFEKKYNPNGSYTVAHIQGATTVFVVYNNNQLIGTETINVGCNTMQKNAIDTGVVLTPDQYISMVRAYNRGHLDSHNLKIMQDVFQVEYKTLKDVINRISETYGIEAPKDLYVVSDHEVTQALVKNINTMKHLRAIQVKLVPQMITDIDQPLNNSTTAVVNFLA